MKFKKNLLTIRTNSPSRIRLSPSASARLRSSSNRSGAMLSVNPSSSSSSRRSRRDIPCLPCCRKSTKWKTKENPEDYAPLWKDTVCSHFIIYIIIKILISWWQLFQIFFAILFYTIQNTNYYDTNWYGKTFQEREMW